MGKIKFGNATDVALPWPALVVLISGLALVLGAFIPVVHFAAASDDVGSSLVEAIADPVIWRALRFTLWQASLSTILSVVFAVPVALFMHDRGNFAGKRLILQLFSIPLALPQIVAVLAIVGLYGRNGWITGLLQGLGLPNFTLFGLTGILLAHVFFNMPLVVRVMMLALERQPAEYAKIAAMNAMPWQSRARFLHWPMARAACAQAAILVFMLCVTSFTVVLTLGGGPRATTLEVAIYHALTFDFNLARATALIALQVTVTASIAILISRFGRETDTGSTLFAPDSVGVGGGAKIDAFAYAILFMPVMFVALPFANIVAKGVTPETLNVLTKPATVDALITSVSLASCSAVLTTLAAFALGHGICRLAAQRRFVGDATIVEKFLLNSTAAVLVLPPIVLAAGWFILFRSFTNPFQFGAVVIVAINTLMALPFAARLMVPSMLTEARRTDRLSRQLGITGISKLRIVDLPLLRKPLLAAFSFAAALSLGDVSVIALYGSQDLITLPSLILAKMGSYRSDEAHILAFILCVLTAAIMIVGDRQRRAA
ncbi:MAG: thiamine/thiamine pyrophosphate ABC transporter permease ThiP [Pseudomonadota bacterium]